ncbi:MAG: VOC family protein [Acidimicrobiales bacterium]
MKSFLYLHCNDLPAARHFYSALIGLEEVYHSDEPQAVGYRVGSLQLTMVDADVVQLRQGWSSQLGWAGGVEPLPSWGFELEGRAFVEAVEALLAEGVPVWRDQPSWVGYWSFPVRDPMGNTVELSTPDRDSWPAGLEREA